MRVRIREYGSNLDGTTGRVVAIFQCPRDLKSSPGVEDWEVKAGDSWAVVTPDEIGHLGEPGVVLVPCYALQYESDWPAT